MSRYANEARTHVCMNSEKRRKKNLLFCCCGDGFVWNQRKHWAIRRSKWQPYDRPVCQTGETDYSRTGLIFCVQFFFLLFLSLYLWIAPFKFITQYSNDDHRFLFISATKTKTLCIHSILTISFHVFNDIIAGFYSEISFGIHEHVPTHQLNSFILVVVWMLKEHFIRLRIVRLFFLSHVWHRNTVH